MSNGRKYHDKRCLHCGKDITGYIGKWCPENPECQAAKRKHTFKMINKRNGIAPIVYVRTGLFCKCGREIKRQLQDGIVIFDHHYTCSRCVAIREQEGIDFNLDFTYFA